jgi:hypothetical protein
MRTLFVLCIIFVMAFDVQAQGRKIDLAAKITNPMDGDSFVSPRNRVISVYLFNLGPDTIISKDEYSVKFIFSAFHIFPEFERFNTTILPGDSFLYQRELNIAYSGDVDEMKFCTEVYAFSRGRDSIRVESETMLDNNKHCVTTSHIDSSAFSDVNAIETQGISCYPNPVTSSLNIKSPEPIISAKVIDLNGQTVLFKKQVNMHNLKIDMSDYAPSVYFIQTETKSGVSTQKVIRN